MYRVVHVFVYSFVHWFKSAPHNFSNASAGTIKAAEWCSLITVYIPLGLISIWGTCDSDSDTKVVLDHTMSLVLAIYVACAHMMTVERASVYCSCITNYVGNLTHLYPTIPPRPNHHVAFHIFDYLVLFGPVHSWWTFPFKHLIGVLQRELKNTMFHSYLKDVMLHAWLSQPNCPTSICECQGGLQGPP
ncbi:hypothetical protein EV363DRAFT_1151720 [Boletus edulis]|nr:hypothetical protein EV363DRAFT_1151720 [Boletus edulis]